MAIRDVEALLETARRRQTLPPPETRREIRERAGLSQAELAAAVGVGPTAIARWELGQRHPRHPHLDRYADVLALLARL